MNTINSYEEYMVNLAKPTVTFYYLYSKTDSFSNSGKTLLDQFIVGYSGAEFYAIESSEHPDIAKKLMILGSPSIWFGRNGVKGPTTRFAATNPQIILTKVASEFSRRGIIKN